MRQVRVFGPGIVGRAQLVLCPVHRFFCDERETSPSLTANECAPCPYDRGHDFQIYFHLMRELRALRHQAILIAVVIFPDEIEPVFGLAFLVVDFFEDLLPTADFFVTAILLFPLVSNLAFCAIQYCRPGAKHLRLEHV